MAVRKVLRRPAVLAATGWSGRTLSRKIGEQKFPAGIKLEPTSRALVWFEDEVSSWQGVTDSLPDLAPQPKKAKADKELASLAKSAKHISQSLAEISKVLQELTGYIYGDRAKGRFFRVSNIGD